MNASPDARVERWTRFREARNRDLAAEHGWLTLTSFEWLETRPGAVGSLPGSWSSDGTTALLTAAVEDGLTFVGTGRPVTGTVPATLADEESLMWVQYGGDDGTQVVVELARRANRYALRTRDSESPVRMAFDGIPTFGYRPDLVVEARYEAYPEPVEESISTANPLVGGVHRAAGEVVFRLPRMGSEYRLQAAADQHGALTVTFSDATNGNTTAGWRRVSTGKPHPDGSVILDFNRAVNYPSAFTSYGTCPMPVKGNSLDVGIEAGEKRPAGAEETGQP